MRRRIPDLLGAMLIAGSLLWLVVLAHAAGGSDSLRLHSWLPTASAGR